MPFRFLIKSGQGERPARKPLRTLGRGIPSLTALLFILGVLLVFNLSSLRFMKLLEDSKEQDLALRLRSVARMIAYELRTPLPPVMLSLVQDMEPDEESDRLSEFADTSAYQRLAEQMWGLERLNQLSQCVLMTVNGNIVADSTGKTSPGSAYVFRDTDRHAIDTAASGQPAAMRLYPVGDQLFKRVYVPLVSGSKVIGVVQVAASADYFAAMREDQRRARFQMLVSSALLLLIGFSIYRLFAHLVQAEKRAVQLARIEAMGALAGGVAHELRNPLSIIRVLSEEILTEQPPDSPSARNARDVIAEIERLNEMVTHYLSLSKLPDATGLEVIDLGGELARVAQLMRKGAETNLEVKTELPAAPVYVRADSRALRQVFLNLLLNARDALPGDGGEVRVTLRERRGSAEIHVIDTGCGIPAREIARVFEPFYSTKRMGTGLGLPITRSIVENLGGEMAITSNPGKGTDVCVILPATLAPEGTSGS